MFNYTCEDMIIIKFTSIEIIFLSNYSKSLKVADPLIYHISSDK